MSERDPLEEIAALRAALAAERAKGEAFADLNHELRTLLSGLSGITGLLLDTELSSEQRDYVKRARAHCDALTDIVNHVLDWSRAEAGKLHLEVADVDVRRVIEEVGELFAGRAHDKGIELVIAVSDDVPAGLRGDATRLRQVLVNLVGNAIKFTDHGEVVVRAATAGISADHARVRFEVSDTGVGISAEGQARLFQPFSQVHEGGYGGSGLGLALARRIVEAMDGAIGVESVEGKGSRFELTARFERRLSALDRHAIPRVDVAGRRVLLAAPSAAVRAALGAMMSALGVDQVAVDDRARAIAALSAAASERPFAVVLIDLALPGARELCAAIEAEPALAALGVVLLGYPGQRLDDDDARAPRRAAYLAKPVRRGQLFACLRTLLGGSLETVTSAPAPRSDAAPESRRAAPVSRRPPRHDTPVAVSSGRAARRSARLASAASADERPLVLLVEDNAVNQRVGKLMLEKRGYRVEVASDGHEAVAATARRSYVAVLMDCQMPRHDGYAATRDIRERDQGKPRLPIIAMTANAGPGARERCLAAGMDDYVAKPVTGVAIDEVLRRWVPLASPPPPVAPPVRRSSSPAIDLSMLHQLRATQRPGEPDIVAEVTAIFLNDAPARMSALREAASRGEIANAGRAAHTLKGSAGHLGARTLVALCARFEEKARAGADFDAAFAVEAIEQELARVCRALRGEAPKT